VLETNATLDDEPEPAPSVPSVAQAVAEVATAAVKTARVRVRPRTPVAEEQPNGPMVPMVVAPHPRAPPPFFVPLPSFVQWP
jgi:hypothetical protein